MLEIQDLVVSYGGSIAVHGLNMVISPAEIVSLIGANGAGKTSTLNAITGVARVRQGSIRWNGVDLLHVPSHQIIRHHIAYCREGRHLFNDMTVQENLLMGAYCLPLRHAQRSIDRVLALFPVMADRLHQLAGTLSGGQQQMVAVMRALMSEPMLLLLDEPSLGLSPKACDGIFQVLPILAKHGTAILVVEQNAVRALDISQRAYVMEVGRIVVEGNSVDLTQDDRVREAYLGYGVPV